MKKLIIVLLSTAVMPLASADELKIKGYIKSDPIRGANHYLISNNGGSINARMKPDPLWPSDSDRSIIIDKEGTERGRIKSDYVNKNRYIIETVK